MIRKIVIASILKPVDDVRGYWKIAQSMSKTNKYEVNIIGNTGKKEPKYSNILFHCFPVRRNQWIKRATLRFKILLRSIRINPDILVITTHELLLVAIYMKIFTGSKIIYDVQENYRRNITLNSSLLSKIYSYLVAIKEDLLCSYFDHFWFAEKCYREELKFGKGNYSIIQNKALDIPINRNTAVTNRILFSGTISYYSGIKTAIKIIKELIKIKPETEAVIIGQVHDHKLYSWLEKESQKCKNIQVRLSFDPVPYDEIIEKMEWANLGIITYHPNEINQNKIPTKLYEYSRYRLSYLVQENTLWSKVGNRLGYQIPIDLYQPNISKILVRLKESRRTTPKSYTYTDTWEYESAKLLNSIDKLLTTA